MQTTHVGIGERCADAAEWVKAYIDAIVQATRGESAAAAAYSRGMALATCTVRHTAADGQRSPTRRLARAGR